MIKILFLAANPRDTQPLRLDEESRAIDDALQKTEFRGNFKLERHGAVHASDLQGLLQRHKPTIVHFSGHGSSSAQIILQDEQSNSHPVSGQWLKQLFALLKAEIKCVVLNACYSQSQAESIADEIDCVIGIPQQIDDVAATKFAAAFYEALGYGQSLATAYELGLLQFDLANPTAQGKPQLITKNVNPAEVRFADPQRFLKRLSGSVWVGVAGIRGIVALALIAIIWILSPLQNRFQSTALPPTLITAQAFSQISTLVQETQSVTPVPPTVIVTHTAISLPVQITVPTLVPTDTSTQTPVPTVTDTQTPMPTAVPQCRGTVNVPGSGVIAPLYRNPAVALPYAEGRDIREGAIVEVIDQHNITGNEVMYKIVKENGAEGWLQQQYLNFDCPNIK